MQPITYRKKLRLGWKDELLFTSTVFFLIALGWTFRLASDWKPLAERELHDLVFQIAIILLFCVVAAGFLRLTLPKNNSLQLDANGLTYQRGGERRAWPWSALSGFTVLHGLRGRRIEFTVSEGDKRARTGQWLLRRSKTGPKAVIEDVWDRPLDEIAATLNASREQALGGADAPT